MENTSWIKLYRKLLESPIFENEKALKVWIWCLCKATHKDREQLVGKQMVQLKKGQFVTGRKKAGQELKMNERTVYDYFQLLKNLKMIHIESNTKFTTITIENWEEYQIEEMKFNSNFNNKITTNQQQINTNKNVKNIYTFFLKKYREENLKSFHEKMKFLRNIKNTEEYKQLNPDEENELREIILNQR